MPGHIRPRKRTDGERVYQARYPDPCPKPGKGNQDLVQTFERKRDAENWLATQHAAVVRGEFLDPRRAGRPFSELVEAWRETRVGSLAPKTRERYDSVLRTYLTPEFGHVPIGKLTREVARRYFARLAAEGVSPGTARKVQVVLSSVLSEGVELGLVRENVAARMKLPSPPRHDMTILTAEEVRALASAVERASDRLAIYVAAYTGLRAGELWALQRRDVDLPGRRLLVGRTLQDQAGHLSFSNAMKTDGSRRVVSLPAFLVNMLTEHLATLGPAADALLFTSPGGGNGRAAGEATPIRHSLFVRRVFRPAATKALPAAKASVRFHDLRHTCAALLIAAGRHPLEIKTRLGHASITTTMDRYGQLFPSAEAALADALDATYDAGNVSPLEGRIERRSATV